MQAVILAGGLGTRLWPLTTGTPKPLLPVLDRPLLAHLIEHLPQRVEEVFLAVSFEAEEVQAWVDGPGQAGLGGRKVHVVKEDPPLGTGGALAHLADRAGMGSKGPFFVLNGDLLADVDLQGLLEAHEARGSLGTIALVEVADPSRFGIVDLGKDREIRRFVEKPAPDEAPSRWANAGAYVLDPVVLEGIPRGRPVSLEREMFPAWVKDPRGMRGRAHEGLWIDCGTRESYLQAHRELMRIRGDGDEADPEGPGVAADCYVQSRVEVAPDARVQGSVVHEGAVIRSGAVIRGCVVGARAVVGAGASLDRCIVGRGVKVREGLKVEDGRLVDEVQ